MSLMTLDQTTVTRTYGRGDQPLIRLMGISSLDGAASRDGTSGALGNAADQRLMLHLRELADVVLVGAATVKAEGYDDLGLDAEARRRRINSGLPEVPRLAVVSGSLDLDPRAGWSTASPRPLVLTTASADGTRRRALSAVAEVVSCGDDGLDAHAIIRALHERGHHQVLCEGGPRLAGALAAADLLDEVCLTLAPSIEGGGAPRLTGSASTAPREMALVSALRSGDHLFLHYVRPPEEPA